MGHTGAGTHQGPLAPPEAQRAVPTPCLRTWPPDREGECPLSPGLRYGARDTHRPHGRGALRCGHSCREGMAPTPTSPRLGSPLGTSPPTRTCRTWDILYPEASCRPVSLYLIHFRNTLFMSPWSSLELARELLTSAPTTGDFRKHPRSDRCPQPCSGAVGLWAEQTEEPLSPLGPAPTHLRSSARGSESPACCPVTSASPSH